MIPQLPREGKEEEEEEMVSFVATLPPLSPSFLLNNSFSKRQLVKFVRRSRISVPLVNISVESDKEEERRKLCGPEYEILPEM